MNDSLKEETKFSGRSVSQQRKVIHFSSGETLEDDDSEKEEEEDKSEDQMFKEDKDMAKVPWRACIWSLGRKSLRSCDFIGGKLAGLLGLNTAKYQYAVDEYQRETQKIVSKDSACFYDEGTEKIQLSSRMSRKYGTTPLHRSVSLVCKNTEHRTGSHNIGYQNDKEH
ncbi:hypothetical protein UPYG_G00253090 [Umbra pygmaea]|uniref:Protein FAM177A1 n=1 Tax=Umbra pygmaea TaxID=75934 RepID=A0ABD0W7X2_UMBPY